MITNTKWFRFAPPQLHKTNHKIIKFNFEYFNKYFHLLYNKLKIFLMMCLWIFAY